MTTATPKERLAEFVTEISVSDRPFVHDLTEQRFLGEVGRPIFVLYSGLHSQWT